MPVRAPKQSKSPAARTTTAAAYDAWQRGDAVRAKALCRAALRRDRGDVPATRLLGIIAYRAGHHDEALARLRPVCADAADHSNLGAVLRAAGRPAEAEAAYRHAIALDPGFAAAHYNLGNLLADMDRPDDAEANYRAAIAAQPKYAEAYNALGTMLQRSGALRSRRPTGPMRTPISAAPCSVWNRTMRRKRPSDGPCARTPPMPRRREISVRCSCAQDGRWPRRPHAAPRWR
jgi:tetratricopeptide (TPR) repeat protein